MRRLVFLNLLHPASFFLIFYGVFLVARPLLLATPLVSLDFKVEPGTFVLILLYGFCFAAAAVCAPMLTGKKPRPTAEVTFEDDRAWLYVGLLLCLGGLASMALFYLKAGGIPLLASSPEICLR